MTDNVPSIFERLLGQIVPSDPSYFCSFTQRIARYGDFPFGAVLNLSRERAYDRKMHCILLPIAKQCYTFVVGGKGCNGQ